MERRTLLTGMAGTALAGVPVFRSPVTVPRTVTMSDVETIRQMLIAITAADYQFGGGFARETALGFLEQVVQPRLAAHATDEVRTALFVTAAEFAERVAWMHLDVLQARPARQLMGLAFGWAQETNDIALLAWVLAMRGLQEIWLGNTAQALAYTAGAAGMAEHVHPGVRAYVLGKHARALALTGDRRATEAVLGQVRDCMDRAQQPPMSHPVVRDGYGMAYLLDEEAHCYRDLGLGAKAIASGEGSLELRRQDGSFARSRAFCTGVLAIAHVQEGEIEQACAVGHELVGLAHQMNSRRTTNRLGEVIRALAPYGDVPEVRVLREAARPVLQGVT